MNAWRLFVPILLLFAVIGCAGDDDPSTGSGQANDNDDAVDDDTGMTDDDAVDDDTLDDDIGDDDTVDDDTVDDDTLDDDTVDDDIDERTPHFTDDLGREVIVHGVNYMGLEYGGFNHSQEDYDRIAAWGFTHVRLPVSWKYMEPEPGVWTTDYLTETVAGDLDMAQNAGLQVILDMHQWQWCSAFGGNGSPDWACEGLYPAGIMGMMMYAADFWYGDLHEHWAQAWRLTWETIGDHPAIWGYDLFNEPWAGLYTILPAFELEVLQPFYEGLIADLREAGGEQWALIEPQMSRDFLPLYLQPFEDEKTGYAPHLYTCQTAIAGVGYWCGEFFVEQDMRMTDKQRRRLGMPTLVGEFGITTDAEGLEEWMHDSVAAHDRYGYSETVWCYHRDDAGWGLLYADGTEKEFYLRYLLRPYPRAVAGHIESYEFDFDSREFTLTFTDGDAQGDTEIFVPARHYPAGFTVASGDPTGDWSYAYDEESQVLTYSAEPNANGHTVTISPATGR